ncbi:MAG: TIGR03643 family protein [Rhizobiaceae bacterium]|nr:TIGR03643 family protein [Rhizobiaceae bacterium]
MTEPIDPETSHIIEMAWCDKTSFDDIEKQTGIAEKDVIKLMRRNLKPNSFKIWRERVTGRKRKHTALSSK